METITAESIEEYFESIVAYNNNIFGISQNGTTEEINYIYKFERIFSFVDLLQKLDDSFKNDFLDIMLHDIIKLLQQRSLSNKNSYGVELGFIQFANNQKIPLEKSDTYKLYLEIFKKYKPTLDNLLNTKFYYLDHYLCYQISESKKVQYFLGTKDIINMGSIMEYIDQDKSRSFMKLNYNFFGIDTLYPYEKEQIQFIKSLPLKPPKEENPAIEKLIRYKEHIGFFDNLDDEDIRALVTDATFKKYKINEPVIIERDASVDIFFLVSGECKIMLKGQEIGTIPPQSIFGEFAFITKQKRSATIKPTKESIIISFNFDLYSFEHNPCIYSKLYNNISNILVKKLTDQNVIKGYD